MPGVATKHKGPTCFGLTLLVYKKKMSRSGHAFGGDSGFASYPVDSARQIRIHRTSEMRTNFGKGKKRDRSCSLLFLWANRLAINGNQFKNEKLSS